MNLRDHLKELLPHVLPGDPAEAIKGTELIQVVKLRLREEYSDATLRYHFSIMCSDPGSPIAKVEHGQGYYLRRNIMGANGPVSMAQAKLGMTFETAPDVLDQAMSRQQKFRAIYAREMETMGHFPFLFESSFAPGAPYENVWKCPDAVVVDWEGCEMTDTGLKLDSRSRAMKEALGVPPFALCSVKLKVQTSHTTYREDFFQALSNARWGHSGDLVIATPVEDTQLAEELRQLGAEFDWASSATGSPLKRWMNCRRTMTYPRCGRGSLRQCRGCCAVSGFPRPARAGWSGGSSSRCGTITGSSNRCFNGSSAASLTGSRIRGRGI